MGSYWKSGRSNAPWWLAVTAVLSLALALPSPAHADEFDKALAEIDAALETNPHGVSEDSLRSCQAMRKTAVLLRKMGKYTRAARRIKSCRRLLGIEGYPSSGSLRNPELPCIGCVG